MNKKTIYRLTSLLLCAALLLALAGCGKKNEEDETPTIELADTVSGQRLTAGVAADHVFSLAVDFDPDTGLNPLRTRSSASLLVAGLVYDNMFDVDEQYNLSSRIVTDYYSNDDGDFWTFVIDNTLPMHDGTTLTAYDVAYSLNRAMMYSDYFKSRLTAVGGVSAYSDSELCISTVYPDSRLPYRLTIPIIKYQGILSKAPAGSGPYKFAYSGATVPTEEEEPQPQETAGENGEAVPTPSPTPEPEYLPDMLVAFSEYDSEVPLPIDVIYLRQYTDPASNISDYESALVDLVVNDPTGTYNLGYGGMNEKRVYPTTHMHYIGFNGYSNFLCYATYRHAISLLVDRETIANSIMDGGAVAAALPINPACSLYDQTLADSVAFSLDASLEEFTRLGCGDLDGDGEMEFSLSGSKVDINLIFIVCADSAYKVTAARRIVADMRSLGIPVTLRELGWSEYQDVLTHPRDEDTGKATYDMYYDEVALTADWDLMPFFQKDGALNYGMWSVQSMLDAINVYMSSSELERQAACSVMCQELVTSALIIPICFEKRTVLSHLGVIRGMAPNQYNVFYNIGNWTINLQ